MPNLELIDKIVPKNGNDFPLLESAYFDAEFIPTRIYKKDRIVSYLGEFYYSLVETTNNVTPNLSPEWKKIATGNFIPLTGTEVGIPVTGDIETTETVKGFWGKGANYPDDYSGFQVGEGGTNIYYKDDSTGKQSNLLVTSTGIVITAIQEAGNVGNIRGLIGLDDFTPNITALDYTQKKYVDKGTSYSTTETTTGGTWIDGKPIYRKVFPINMLISVDGYTQLLDEDVAYLSIEIAIKTTSLLKCNGTSYFENANITEYSNNNISFGIWVEDNANLQISLQTVGQIGQTYTGFAIIEYTKINENPFQFS